MVADYNRTVYVSLEQICDWMYYGTHHSDKDTRQFVHNDVPSDYLYHWMF